MKSKAKKKFIEFHRVENIFVCARFFNKTQNNKNNNEKVKI